MQELSILKLQDWNFKYICEKVTWISTYNKKVNCNKKMFPSDWMKDVWTYWLGFPHLVIQYNGLTLRAKVKENMKWHRLCVSSLNVNKSKAYTYKQIRFLLSSPLLSVLLMCWLILSDLLFTSTVWTHICILHSCLQQECVCNICVCLCVCGFLSFFLLIYIFPPSKP